MVHNKNITQPSRDEVEKEIRLAISRARKEYAESGADSDSLNREIGKIIDFYKDAYPEYYGE